MDNTLNLIKQACENFVEKNAANKATRVALRKLETKGLLPNSSSYLAQLKGNLKRQLSQHPEETLSTLEALPLSPKGARYRMQETFAQRKARRIQAQEHKRWLNSEEGKEAIRRQREYDEGIFVSQAKQGLRDYLANNLGRKDSTLPALSDWQYINSMK